MPSPYVSLFNGWAEWSSSDCSGFYSNTSFIRQYTGGTGSRDPLTVFRDMDDALCILASEQEQAHKVFKAHYVDEINNSVVTRCRKLGVGTKTYYRNLAKAENFVLYKIGIIKKV